MSLEDSGGDNGTAEALHSGAVRRTIESKAVPSEDDRGRSGGELEVSDPRLIGEVARSLTSALGTEQISAAISAEMSRFLPGGAWSMNLAGACDAGVPPHDPARVWIPMAWHGEVLGWLEGPPESESDILPPGFLKLVAEYAAIALHNTRALERLRTLTIIDDCTGLYNSRHLASVLATEVERSRRFQFPFSLLFLDLDYFKNVNDRHGHLAGSWLLARVGETIKACIRGIDSAFRYGGDEFVILLPQTGKSAAIEVGLRLLRAFRTTCYPRGEELELEVRASIGLASYPEDGISAEEMIRAADRAMYLVKETTRDNLAVAGRGAANS